MNNHTVKRLSNLLCCLVLIISAFPFIIHGDMGPHPSVQISFKYMDDALCYATLLSKERSTGPASSWDGSEDDIHLIHPQDKDDPQIRKVWEAFVDFKDNDGFYFLQWFWQCNETKQLNWNYYPPDTFKVLLYYPDSGEFVESQICETYAFDSYFAMYLNNLNGSPAKVVRNYNHFKEILAFICRLLITLTIELIIAFAFSFKDRKTLGFIVIVNIATQLALNVCLNIIKFKEGYLMFLLSYILLEVIVFIVEALSYVLYFKHNKQTGKPIKTSKIVIYALLGNAASFILGFIITYRFPEMF